MLKLVSYDLDGTLVDTLGEIAEAVNLMLDDLGIPRRAEAEIATWIGKGMHELLRAVMAKLDAEAPAGATPIDRQRALDHFERRYGETAGRLGVPYPGCAESLARLHAAGITLVCTTNKEQRHAERVLAATGLGRWFTLLVGGDTLGVKKPDAKLLNHVLAHFGVAASEAVHVGDSSIDVAAARASGTQAWAVSYGYNGGVPIGDARPDRVFDALQSVADAALAAR